MKISVILAARNAEKHIKEAVKSILQQTLSDFEFIIVDDASSDQTGKVLTGFRDERLKIVTNRKKKGLTVSLNLAIKMAKGRYLARMDADDIALPHRLARQAEILDDNSEIALVGTWAELIDEKGRNLGLKKFPTTYQRIKKVIMRFNPFIHPSVMIRRAVIEKIGFYDESLDGAEDYDLFLRIVRDYRSINIPEIYLRYRIQKESISWQEMKKVEKAAIKARWKALKVYHYPWWQIIFLVKPIISYVIPVGVKHRLLSD